jgi:phosphonate transport system ATP-binding protein
MPADAAFQIEAVSKSFGARRALDGVTLTIGAGEMVALIGPSGSGKSTLLRALNGLIAIDGGGGRIEAFGQPVQMAGKISDQVRGLRARIGFVFQQFNLVGRLSLFANVALGLLGRIPAWRGVLGLWPKAEAAGVMNALQRVGMAEYAGQRASTLSGGQQQRGAIARALAQKAQVILADEPVSSLDPVAARRILELLRDLNQKDGLTVVVSLHQVDCALRYCPRVVALQDGKLVYDGPGAGLDRDRLVQIYGPEIEDVLWEGQQP